MQGFHRVRSWIAFVAMVLLSVSIACQSYSTVDADAIAPAKSSTPAPQVPALVASPSPELTNSAQLVDLQAVNAAIRLDLRYATVNNFTHQKLYPQARCLLRTIAAEQLSQVQTDLEAIGLGLKVYDCYRPLSVQKQLWKLFPNDRYVANPATGSRHNRGSAVDVSLVDRAGKELIMPTTFDDFTEQAASNYDGANTQATQNRQQLKEAMIKHSFIPLESEWWHFDVVDWAQFPILDTPLEASL